MVEVEQKKPLKQLLSDAQVEGFEAVQTPLTQAEPLGHGLPHAPQLLGSVKTLTQAPLQLI